VNYVGFYHTDLLFVCLLFVHFDVETCTRAGESSKPIAYTLRIPSKKFTGRKWHLADGCFVVATTNVITGHRKPDADKLQAAVADNQLWLTCFWFRPQVQAFPTIVLWKCHLIWPKAKKPRDIDVNYCNFHWKSGTMRFLSFTVSKKRIVDERNVQRAPWKDIVLCNDLALKFWWRRFN